MYTFKMEHTLIIFMIIHTSLSQTMKVGFQVNLLTHACDVIPIHIPICNYGAYLVHTPCSVFMQVINSTILILHIILSLLQQVN